MNRRKLLAAGVGLGTLGLISKASQAVGNAETDAESDFTGPVYCPMFPYMFCGSYTLYYAVQNDDGVCGANPGSMAGPNGLVCGCPGPSCQPTLSIRGSKDARKKIVGDSTYIHQHLDKLGMKKLPNNKVNFAPGADPVGNPGGYLVKFTDKSGKERNARVFEVLIRKSKIDGDMLDLLGIDKNIIEDKTFYIGHEEVVESSDVFEDPAASGVWISDITYQVIASIDGDLTEFLVVMKRP